MNKTIQKFTTRANNCVREVKISLGNSGVADIENAMNRVVDQAERLQKLASRGPDFDKEREEGLEKVWANLAELQEMASGKPVPVKTIGSPLKATEQHLRGHRSLTSAVIPMEDEWCEYLTEEDILQ